ncbi:hypothetical protein N7499_010158 [Penicillium canescens]|nr:hypothetical protein N7444_011773 [Penicillium canescens]KAJ6072144.1 hypothetical protein N7499_010158 [Penicillium canescens]
MVRQKSPSVNKNANATTKEDLNKKRLRNRLSQQTFRRRQADRLRQLLDDVNATGRPDDETNRALREENRRLRRSLIELESKIARLVVTVQGLSETVSNAVVDTSRDESNTFDSYQGHATSATATEELVSNSRPTIAPKPPFRRELPLTKSTQPAAQNAEDHEQEIRTRSPSIDCNAALNIAANFDSLAQQIPSIWSFEYQMGPGPYADCLAGSEDSSLILGRAWTESNSPFSDHIHVLQSLMRSKLDPTVLLSKSTIDHFYQEVLMVLALFNSMTRPDVMRWDRLIQFHAANPRIDQIFCDVVSSYVVEAWMSDLIAGAPMIKAHIRVTDLVQNIDPSAFDKGSNKAANVNLPAPDVATLFSSTDYSLAVFNHLGMDLGVSNYKIDPAFFATYPELYDHSACISGEGISLRPEAQARLTYPKPLDSQIFQTYRNFIEFSYGWPLRMSGVFG